MNEAVVRRVIIYRIGRSFGLDEIQDEQILWHLAGEVLEHTFLMRSVVSPTVDDCDRPF